MMLVPLGLGHTGLTGVRQGLGLYLYNIKKKKSRAEVSIKGQPTGHEVMGNLWLFLEVTRGYTCKYKNVLPIIQLPTKRRGGWKKKWKKEATKIKHRKQSKKNQTSSQGFIF